MNEGGRVEVARIHAVEIKKIICRYVKRQFDLIFFCRINILIVQYDVFIFFKHINLRKQR